MKNKLNQQWNEIIKNIPAEIQLFLKRALLVFIVWKLLYHIILFPNRIIDKPLTSTTAAISAKLYKILYKPDNIYVKDVKRKESYSNHIFINTKRGIGIADECNGLELHILFLGFILCYPGNNYRIKIVIGAIGILVIFYLNIVRVTFLAKMNYDGNQYADFAHHYLFKMIIYSIIFLMWVLFIKIDSKKI